MKDYRIDVGDYKKASDEFRKNPILFLSDPLFYMECCILIIFIVVMINSIC
jgi:hypothetical protein